MPRSETQPTPKSMRGTGNSRASPVDGGDDKHENSGHKRSFLDKLRGRKKDDKSDGDSLISAAGSNVSLPLPPNKNAKEAQTSAPQATKPSPKPEGSAPELTRQTTRQSISQGTSRKEHLARLPFTRHATRRGLSSEAIPGKETPSGDQPPPSHPSLWSLDTDLSQMEGIVSAQPPPPTPPVTGNKSVQATGDFFSEQPEDPPTAGAWDAPDSWAIKKTAEEGAGKLHEIDEAGEAQHEEDPGIPFGIRIFRHDSTFFTFNLMLNTTAAELIQQFAKKISLQDDIESYQIIMRKHNTARQLEPLEKPIILQKKMLEQAGYNDTDHLDLLGREDHSYLCRFSFTHAKKLGYASLEKDPAFSKTQKLHNLDLAGHNLITIPVALYKKANEIIAINLSRNIAIDVPKDFIQACTSLREIRFTGNEAWRLPPSFCLAGKLTILDISNNRLEQLDHASLDKLENLAALSLANNKLTRLPSNFNQFKSLRKIVLSSNNLNELPKSICEIRTLTDLDVSFNQLTHLSNIGNLENLERLYATNNKLSGSLDESMAKLAKLHELDVRFNALESIDVCFRIPLLDSLSASHNTITAFEGSLAKIRILILDHNPITRFGLESVSPVLSTFDLGSAKLSQLPDELFQQIPNIQSMKLDKNHFVSISPQIGRLQKLERLSVAKNALTNLPAEIGRCSALRILDVRENNIGILPSELWFCRSLETLNASCNILESFPKPPTQIPTSTDPAASNMSTPTTPTAAVTDIDAEDLDTLSEMGQRRPSQASGYLSNGSSNGTSTRKGSFASSSLPASRKHSMLSRTSTDTALQATGRKESVLLNRVTSMFAGSLKNLYLADNRLSDDVFEQVAILQELKVLNLSYNDLDDLPPRTCRRWQNLEELYLSGNNFSCLPSEDLEEISNLKILHINCNRFQVLPAELGKVSKLAVLDASSNSLKYNVYNWPYDWNWNSNPQLRYLSLSNNKRLEIKPPNNYSAARENENMTDFSALTRLRVLGLMDVTLMIPSVPDNTEDRRVRTSGSTIGSMGYGIADYLGQEEHVSTMDMIVPKLEGHDDETLFGLFDGLPQANSGSKSVKFLQDNFEGKLKEELRRAKGEGEGACDALRRTYLALNRSLATLAQQPVDAKERRPGHGLTQSTQSLGLEDLSYGCVATIMYLHGMDLYVSNIGDVQAILIQSEGGHRFITTKHDPASTDERQRIREAGGYVSRQGKLNDELSVSRAFGFPQYMPAVIAAPYVSHIQIQDTDEIILLASRELWNILTPDFIVDLARSERADPMRAAQKLRDLAIAFGAREKMTVMMVGISDLRRKERARFRSHSLSLGPSGLPDDYMASTATARRGKRGRDATLDSKLARLDQEVEAPVGEVSLVFTDIKSSTLLWETYPIAMRAAIKMHNEVMRRQLRLIGGYEVKTEGDAFIVSFPTVTSALLWAFTVQNQLLEVPWPQEILNSISGQELKDADGNVLFRGLSVRMGIHVGQPVCEVDPVTRRMDYFGPMVNRSARISGVADGGQITVSSDFIAEIQRLLETHIEGDRSDSNASEDQMNEDPYITNIKRELRSLSSQGFEVQDLGERRLKGLENPEYIYLLYPHSLSGRLVVQQQKAEAEKAAESTALRNNTSHLIIDLDNLWDLWSVSLRLEMLCSSLEGNVPGTLRPPETALLERTRERGGEITDRFLLNFLEHQVSRIEVSRII